MHHPFSIEDPFQWGNIHVKSYHLHPCHYEPKLPDPTWFLTEVPHSSISRGNCYRSYTDVLKTERENRLHVQVKFENHCLPINPVMEIDKTHLHILKT